MKTYCTNCKKYVNIEIGPVSTNKIPNIMYGGELEITKYICSECGHPVKEEKTWYYYVYA